MTETANTLRRVEGDGAGAIGSLTHRARVEAAFRGDPLDHPPLSFWMHFPGRDHTADLLTASTVEFQRRYELDLVKLMPTGMYSVMDYGVKVQPSPEGLGTTEYVSGPIQRPEDWGSLPSVSATSGVLAEHVDVVRQVRAALGADICVIQTIFSPLTMAAKLVNNRLSAEHLQSQYLPLALDRLAGDVTAFGQACLDAGADGFFFATMHANQATGRPIYERLGAPYDARILQALRPRSRAIVLHVHGERPFFDLADRYPVDAVNWEDRETEPGIGEALQRTSRCLIGGLGRFDPVTRGTPDQVATEVRDTIRQTNGRRIIVAPGCTLPIAVPATNLRAIVSAVRS